ncbi:16886_t:CDS:1, partial [Gigaspora margarita]
MDKSVDGISNLRSSGIAYTDNIYISEKNQTLELLEKIVQELSNNEYN